MLTWTTVLQTLALLLACSGLWLLCRRVLASAPPRMFLIIAGGFLLRALGGCALFWISFLDLPIARSLQLGDGFWFFALDGAWYFELATTYAAAGLKAIALVPGLMPSPFFIQLLALFEYGFGHVSSVGILFNAICYLVTAAVLVWLSKRDARMAGPATIALLIVSFAPGFALWALQPLKDPLFDCLLALFVAACVAWQDLWSDATRRRVLPRGRADHGLVDGGGEARPRGTGHSAADVRLLARDSPRRGGVSSEAGAHGLAAVESDARRGSPARLPPLARPRAPRLRQHARRHDHRRRTADGSQRGPADGQDAGVFCIRERRAVAPASVLVLASIIAIGAPILYTVNNFGTLFRLRQIIAVQLCLLPLVMTPRR